MKEGNGKSTLKTVAGRSLTVSIKGKKVTVTDEKGGMVYLTIKDVNQSNGVIHVIDHVLLTK